MGKKKYSFFLGFMLILLASTSFAREIVIFNACDFPLQELNLAKPDSDTAYTLLESPLGPQEAIKITLKDSELIWNILAKDPSGGTVSFENIQFTGIKQIHIQGDGTVEIYR